MKVKIYKFNFNSIQTELNRRESVDMGLCTECYSKNTRIIREHGVKQCTCSNNAICGKLRYVATQDLYQMRLQFRVSNNPDDVNYGVKVQYKEDDIILMTGAWEVPDVLYFTFESGRLIKQLTSRFYNKNAYDAYVPEINEPYVYGGTYSEL